MSQFNPLANIAKSSGIDLPILKVYLGGRIAGDVLQKCIEWRRNIILHYRNFEFDYETNTYASYPISFLDPLNSGEGDSIDEKGLESNISPNLIYDKDLLSVKTAQVVVANMDDFFEVGLEKELNYDQYSPFLGENDPTENFGEDDFDYEKGFLVLLNAIKNRRANIGTICEISWALYLQKPLILIVPENQFDTYSKHPFTKRASLIVKSEQELIEGKHLEILYKSIAGSK